MIAVRLKSFRRYQKFANFTPVHVLFSRSVGCATVVENQNESTDGIMCSKSYEHMLQKRRSEANRSVVVQVQSEKSAVDLHQYCSQYGSINKMQHYCLSDQSHFILLEFNMAESMYNLLEQCCHVNESNVIPSRSPFLWFRSNKIKQKQKSKIESNILPLNDTYGTEVPTEKEIQKSLQGVDSLSDQMLTLYKLTHLNDLGERLRFLTAHQIELALKGPFPFVKALPFGSSVNGFGRMGCDLDLVLQLDDSDLNQKWEDCRLVFQAKASAPDGRMSSQRLMETVGDMCQLLLPGITGVKRILQARVPIIKFQQDLTGVECDLSVTNLFGVKMSELLYMMGNFDTRVKPLVFAVRAWAQSAGLTNSVPGRWITNFSLVLLVLYFLQKRSPPILPPLNKFIALSVSKKGNVAEDSLLELLPASRSERNTESLEVLLVEFFTFYTTFDFSIFAINLLNSTQQVKPEHAPLYIVNPLEPALNVSKNVSHEELEKMRAEFKNAAWIMESTESIDPKNKEPWGLLALYKESGSKLKEERYFSFQSNRRRRISIDKLFLEENR